MTDATILIPTYRHAALLPYSIESALDQEGVSVELYVVGDGVEDGTRHVLARYADDPRVHFFDYPKGPRLGEGYRHALLQQAAGRIVCYLSDDDLLLREHAVTMLGLLEDADFAHPPSARFNADGTLLFFPWSYQRPEFAAIARGRVGSIGLTGVAHTMDAYRRLPFGWRTTPEGMPTDHYMWLQFLDLPGFRCAVGDRLTYLTFPEPQWGKLPEAERASQLADWFRRSREPDLANELDRMLRDAILRAAEDYHLWARREQLTVEDVFSSRTWRFRERFVRVAPLRALLARRPESR
jgi:GalNAc5-diNAcBac-PP-undecaprenol beta-1,3-glucosyltransferase